MLIREKNGEVLSSCGEGFNMLEWMAESFFSRDMLQNIIAESLGIIVTVLIIDQLIKQREEKRWKPAKHVLYANLLELIGQLFRETIASDLLETPASPWVWDFGSAHAILWIDFKDEWIAINYGITQRLESDGKFDVNLLDKHRLQIRHVLETSISLMEPDLLEKLMRLDEALITLSSATINWNSGLERDGFTLLLKDIWVIANEIRIWLVQKADQCESLDQKILKFKREQQKLNLEIARLRKIVNKHSEKLG